MTFYSLYIVTSAHHAHRMFLPFYSAEKFLSLSVSLLWIQVFELMNPRSYIALVLLLTLLASLTLSITSVNAQLPLPPGVKREEVVILDTQISKVAKPDLFNVWVIGSQASVYGMQLCMDVLWATAYTDGRNYDILAAGPPEFSPDFSVMTIRIKPGIYWSDGVEMTAEDWVFGIKYALMNRNSPAYATANSWFEDAWVVDRYTFAIKLRIKSPYAMYHFVVLGPGIYNYVMPKHYFLNKFGGNETEALLNAHTDLFNPPVCIGPYVLHSYDPAGTWFLWKRRDDWERSSIGWMVGYPLPWAPNFTPTWPGPKYVMFRVFTTEADKIIAMIRGELDWIFDATPEAWESLRAAMGDKVIAWYKHWPWFWGYDTTTRGIYFNLLKYPYNITAVRWALALAINMTRVLTEGYAGMQRALVNPISAMEPAARYWDPIIVSEVSKWTLRDVLGDAAPPEYANISIWDPDVPFRVYEWGKAQGYLKGVEMSREEIIRAWGYGWWRYLPDVAEAILKNLGFKRGPDGKWLLPNGTPWKIRLNIPAGFEFDAVRLGIAVAAEWKRFGIDVETYPMDASPFWNDLNYGRFEVGSYWGTGASDPMAPLPRLDPWRCEYVKPEGEYSPNGQRYCNPKFDELYLKAMSYPIGSKEALEYAKQALLVFIKDMPVIWMGNCKKLLPTSIEYWTNWPSADNFYWGMKLWGNQPMKIVIMMLKPVKTQQDIYIVRTPTPTPTPSPSPPISPTPTPTPTPMPAATTITVISTITHTVTSVLTSITTVTQIVTEWTTAAILAIVLLIIGFAIGYLIKRR